MVCQLSIIILNKIIVHFRVFYVHILLVNHLYYIFYQIFIWKSYSSSSIQSLQETISAVVVVKKFSIGNFFLTR